MIKCDHYIKLKETYTYVVDMETNRHNELELLNNDITLALDYRLEIAKQDRKRNGVREEKG